MTDLPEQLAEIRDDFLGLEVKERLQLLLEFSNELPALPERYADHPDLFERVEECQSPVFIFVEVDDSDVVHLFEMAPKEAPTTRGFASILAQGEGRVRDYKRGFVPVVTVLGVFCAMLMFLAIGAFILLALTL